MHHQKKAVIMICSFQQPSSRCKFYLKIMCSLNSVLALRKCFLPLHGRRINLLRKCKCNCSYICISTIITNILQVCDNKRSMQHYRDLFFKKKCPIFNRDTLLFFSQLCLQTGRDKITTFISAVSKMQLYFIQNHGFGHC